MRRFINDDAVIGLNKQKAIKMSKADLAKAMCLKARKHSSYEFDSDWYLDEDEAFELIGCFNSLAFDGKDVINDTDVNFDGENPTFDCNVHNYNPYILKRSIGNPLLGFHTLSNGFTFYGYLDCADGEDDAFAIIYFDGEKFHRYVPLYGNAVNIDWNCLIGDEEEQAEDSQYECDGKVEELETLYKKLGIWIDKGDFDYRESSQTRWTVMYFAKYGLNASDYVLNWDAIKKDILAHIEVA